MLSPVVTEPLDLAVMQIDTEPMIVKARVLRIALERICNVHAEGAGVDGQPTVIEETVDVPTEEQAAMFMVNTELRVAVEMAGFQHPRGRLTREGAALTLAGE